MKREDEDAKPGATDSAASAPLQRDVEDADSPPSKNDFRPIKISGEPLSATIIRERRERPW